MSRFPIDFDFGELPAYVASRIKTTVGEDNSFKDRDYSKWTYDYGNYINQIPNEFRLIAMQKSIEYGNACLKYHKEIEGCKNEICGTEEGLIRRISIVDNFISQVTKPKKETEEIPEYLTTSNKEHTTARQVLAMHYIFNYLKVKGIDNTEKARFIEFLTGKNFKNIYTAVSNPLATKGKSFRKDDLIYIRNYFEKLELSEIVKMINNELDTTDK